MKEGDLILTPIPQADGKIKILLPVNFPLMGLSYLTQYDCSTLICDRSLVKRSACSSAILPSILGRMMRKDDTEGR